MAIPLYTIVVIPCLLFFFYISTAYSLKFRIPRFNNDNNNDIVLDGDAKISSGGAIEMINQTDFRSRVGWATFKKPLHLWDPNTEKLSDFSTRFTFSINTYNNSSPYIADGLAFFLAPVGFEIPLNSSGPYLGLFNSSNYVNAIHNEIIAVEFDPVLDPEDPLYEHVGINVNTLKSAVDVTWDGPNGSFHNRDPCNVWITYKASMKNLSVYWTYDKNAVYDGYSSLLSLQVDLRKHLPPSVMVGFSASTYDHIGQVTLLSWDFQYGSMAKNAVVLLILSKKPKDEDDVASIGPIDNSVIEEGAGPKSFSYKNLVSATNNFCQERKLGEGGFGGVYQGTLIDTNQPVAVKKFSRGSSQGQKEYINEVTIISRLRHRNLLQLIGWCHEKKELILVYELMPNGSLDSYLFGKTAPLVWDIRYKIALGLASAILYLHEEVGQCVLHRDIKSSNVLLDSSFNSKLGDFGLARFMDHDRFSQSTGLAGTFGYLAPEYISTGRPSKESDVFSFGVVALEIVCGRKSFVSFGEISQMGLVELVWDLYGKGKISSAVDKKLGNDFSSEEAERLMIVGLWCAHPDRSYRPSIRQAIQVLKKELSLPILPRKMPVPLYHVPEIILTSFSSSLDEIGR